MRPLSRMYFRASLLLVVFVLLVGPSMSNPTGPPGIQNDQLTADIGCTCHGDGLPSTEVLVQISGVPESYALDGEYTFLIRVTFETNGAPSSSP